MLAWPFSHTKKRRLENNLRANRLESSIFYFPEGPILDWGCSKGETTKELRGYFPTRDIIGIDIDPEIIKYARDNNQIEGIKYHCMDGCNIKQELPGPYAAIFAMNNLMQGLLCDIISQEEYSQIIRDMRDCLVPGGNLVFTRGNIIWIYDSREKRMKFSTIRDRPDVKGLENLGIDDRTKVEKNKEVEAIRDLIESGALR